MYEICEKKLILTKKGMSGFPYLSKGRHNFFKIIFLQILTFFKVPWCRNLSWELNVWCYEYCACSQLVHLSWRRRLKKDPWERDTCLVFKAIELEYELPYPLAPWYGTPTSSGTQLQFKSEGESGITMPDKCLGTSVNITLIWDPF